MRTTDRYTWTFTARFRSGAFGWRGSSLACQRIKEAVSEIKSVARKDPVTAAEGAIRLMEKLWPALEHVDSSSGALGNATYSAVDELTDLIVAAPADEKTRRKWLDRLWEAIQEDGVSYLQNATDRWGELCASPQIAGEWADQLLPTLAHVWTSEQPGHYFTGSTACLSCLVAAGRYQEVLDLIERAPYVSWCYRKYGLQALSAMGRPDEAIAYAQASSNPNVSQATIAEECERILLAQGREEEAYERFALRANRRGTNLATFRALRKKYPGKPAPTILQDLIASSHGEEGKWFATAKALGFYDLALRLAEAGPCDPKTLTRAARDFSAREPRFAFGAALAALRWLADGYGYEVTSADVLDAYRYAREAGERLPEPEWARDELRRLLDPEGRSARALKNRFGCRLEV